MQFAKYAGAIFFVCITGIAAWFVDERIHRNAPRSNPDEVIEWKGQVLGWISAVLFRECVQPVWKFLPAHPGVESERGFRR